MKRGQAPKAMSYAAATSSRRPDDAATLWRLLRLLATLAVAVGVVVLPGAWRGPLAARAAALVPEGPRQVTFVNRMHQVIWAAASPGNRPAQLKTTGWVIPPGHSLTITVPGLGTAASGAGRRGATSTPRALAAARLGTAMAGSSARGSVPHRRHLPSTTAVLRTAWTFTTSAWSMARIYQCTSTGSEDAARTRSAWTDVLPWGAPGPWCAPRSYRYVSEATSWAAFRPALASGPTSIAAGGNGQAGQPVTRGAGQLTTRQHSSTPSHSPTHTLMTMLPASSAVMDIAITGSPSGSPHDYATGARSPEASKADLAKY